MDSDLETQILMIILLLLQQQLANLQITLQEVLVYLFLVLGFIVLLALPTLSVPVDIYQMVLLLVRTLSVMRIA